MPDPWTQLPRAGALVYAGILTTTASPPALARDRNGESTTVIVEPPGDAPTHPIAPTCGPSCHGGNANVEPVSVPLVEAVEVAPTCGPSCHEPELDSFPEAPTCGPSCHYGDPKDELAPPPIEPEARKPGCAVEPDPPGLPLALGLGLALGIGLRRRERS